MRNHVIHLSQVLPAVPVAVRCPFSEIPRLLMTVTCWELIVFTALGPNFLSHRVDAMLISPEAFQISVLHVKCSPYSSTVGLSHLIKWNLWCGHSYKLDLSTKRRFDLSSKEDRVLLNLVYDWFIKDSFLCSYESSISSLKNVSFWFCPVKFES